ncbi:HAMP domain-containing sensor histidine kinase [Paenibacillus vini]|uniref:sensor histidine kinase n=1 Tax=Paenibacillus vini TaxID=1476024 RepID=UPI0025B6565E|nr:HAMP domain-containing sensor histidine kinase [Paenibacillus vini]MDN4068231.1 HAMP domain-containing sensor histidine kinase [Paenibacillus vini]
MRIIYILMFLSLWSLGLFILLHRTRSNLWIGLTILLGGSASYAFSMHLSIMPVFADAAWMPQFLSRLLYLSTVVGMNIYFFVLPYVFSMGGLWLNDKMSSRWKWGLTGLFFMGMVLLLGAHLRAGPWNVFNIGQFRWWDGLFVGIGCFFYLLAYFREKNELRRRSQRRTLLFPLVMIWAFMSDYVGFDHLKLGWWSFDLRSNGMWQANFIVILSTVAVVLFFTIRYGFLGIKLRIERERIDYSIRTLTMGVSILNHSIKNEIQKIDYLAEKSRNLLSTGQSEKAVQTIGQVHGLTAHLLHMVNRIKEKAEDVVLDENEHEVRKLLDDVIASSGTLTENGTVTLSVAYGVEGLLTCDAVHIRETLSNLIRNAIDAVPPGGGAVELYTSATRKEFRIEVRDNGVGIPPEHLAKIFEPFFTTKKNALNYGLGLPYCSSVMSKHGGRLSVAETEPGKGTTIMLHFPKYKFKPESPAPSLKLPREHRRLDPLSPS